MHGRNGLILTVRAISPAEELAGAPCGAGTKPVALLVLASPRWGVSALLPHVPLSPLSLQGGPMSHQQLHLLRNRHR